MTSGEDRAAQNFGMEKLPEHDLRYDIADEYVDLVCQLWDSWESDAVVMDGDTGVYADGSKVHTIDFNRRYYKSRGPLNTVRPPQGRPVFIQAGGSPRGREFAAKYADSIIATATGIEGMKAYRDDVRAKMEAHGRKPDDCKVLFLVSPILGDTEEEARRKRQAMISAPNYIEETLIGMASITEIDFSAFDLDAPAAPDHDERRAWLARQVRAMGEWEDLAAARLRTGRPVNRARRHTGSGGGAHGRGHGRNRGRRLPHHPPGDDRPDP